MFSLPFASLSLSTNSNHISPEEQYRRLNSPYQEDLKLVLPIALVNIVDDYANCNLGSNGTRWFTALSKLKLLPASIPSLPSNIHEILTASCQINTNQRVNESHSLWLIPAGNIDILAERFYGVPKNPLTGCLDNPMRRGVSDAFAKYEWILITDLLPKSTAKTHKEQIEMITELRDKAFLSYEVPTFKYALAANILNITAENGMEGLWLKTSEKEGGTRVQETFKHAQYKGDDFEIRKGVLSVGSSWENSKLTVIPIINDGDCETLSTSTGIAALYRFPESKHSSCVLS